MALAKYFLNSCLGLAWGWGGERTTQMFSVSQEPSAEP